MAWGYQQAGNAALRLQDVLSIEQISHPQVSVRIPDDMTVTFDDVSSSYLTPDGVIPALSHVNLTLRPGTVTALVGPSGVGQVDLGDDARSLSRPGFRGGAHRWGRPQGRCPE